MAPRNVARVEEFFLGMGLQGGVHLIWSGREELASRESLVMGGVRGILSGVSCKHPQSAYAGLQKSIHQEWAIVERVTPGIGDAFVPVEKALWETLLPALFEGLVEGASERGVSRLAVKQAQLALP